MKRLVSLFALSLAACASSDLPTSPPTGERIGEPVDIRPIRTLTTVHTDPESYYNKTLHVTAKVKAVCQKKGCWIQVEDEGNVALVRWETGCGGKYAFPKDSAGERILIQGSFYPKEIDKKDIEHMQEEAGKKVAIPAKGYELNASAVVMLDRQ